MTAYVAYMSTTSENNKRIAKNTIVLYFRMIILMLVSLYTSRVVLDVLGAEDFGLYNVVGGIVIFIGFLNNTLTTASSRYITTALAEDNFSKMRNIFSNVMFINWILCILVVLASETIGLWFLYNKMQIPSQRMDAVFWVYQISVATIVLNIISVPYNAAIVAHEKMTAFAYISLFDAIGKLLMTFSLRWIAYDSLIMYALFIFGIQVVDRIIYGQYCIRKFPETKLYLHVDKPLLKEMLNFIAWSAYGSIATVGFTHGLNILLNIFFGPIVNAARAVSVQVQHNVVSFVLNIQTAMRPQLMIATVNKDYDKAKRLTVACSNYSFYLLCIVGIPIIAETDFILNLWLKEVPDYTVSFCRIMLVTSIWGTLANPLRMVNQAEGHIRKFQLYECTLLLLIVPISYFILTQYKVALTVFIVHLIIELLAQFVRAKIVLPKINMSGHEYLMRTILPTAIVFLIPFVCIFIFQPFMEQGWPRFFALNIILEIILIVSIYIFGLCYDERNYINRRVAGLIKKMKP